MIKVGQQVPSAQLSQLVYGDIHHYQTNELFGKVRHLVSALPGAFTPTCSSTHLPVYEHFSESFLAYIGVDSINCISVNDPFVMESWRKDQNVVSVRMLSDGNGSFTEAMGMLVDKTDLSFGKRSWRYSMFIEDGIIQEVFVEPQEEGDPFVVSDAATMWAYLSVQYDKTDVPVPKFVTILGREGCPVCQELFSVMWECEPIGMLEYNYVELGKDVPATVLHAMSKQQTTPQIWVDGTHVGGLKEFLVYKEALEKKYGVGSND